ncbi:MAG: alpha-amylase family glycosyl hydrolase [Acetobacter sp.]|nr:alpha-amylase family glycosyl hydrolase [Acetobacter sp.]
MKHINNEVIYQIYPLTFNYASGSKSDPYKGAYGNLKGITAYADYVASLGVDAIWITPFYPWGGTGFGYDITDYTAIDPMYGTPEDFAELCQIYHTHNIRVIIDQVYNHCSEKHPWFLKSIAREQIYEDFFVWADAKGYDENGTPLPPNNWTAIWNSEGPSAWSWHNERKQFYLHSFDRTMPNLNLNNPIVRAELLKVAKFWFDLGADGFRLDAATHYACDSFLRDNPLDENGGQIRMYDINSENGCIFINSLKELGLQYTPAKTLLAEYWYSKTPAGIEKAREIGKTTLCDAFFTGALNGKVKDFVSSVSDDLNVYMFGEKLNWAFSNHDLERAATRIFGRSYTPQKLRMLMSLLTTLPGSICIFQGEELGLPNPMEFSACKKPENDPLNIWTPFNTPWDAGRAGFAMSDAPTDPTRAMALQPDAEQYTLSVEKQNEKDSMLATTRNLLVARKNGIFNHYGELHFLPTENEDIIAFIRTVKDSSAQMLCIYNFSNIDTIIGYNDKTYFVTAEDMLHRHIR